MSDIKIHFKIQQYQTDAVESVVNVFKGQPYKSKTLYKRDLGTNKLQKNLFNYDDPDEELYIGFSNTPITLNQSQLLNNIRKIQSSNNISKSDSLIKNYGNCSLDVEMETGTGKTYVYIKTMFELNRLYGWNKFVIVVPSIAIREGVQKSFNITQEHFMEYYKKKARVFIYDSKNLSDIDTFSSSADLSVMIINTQAFNTSFNPEKNKEGKGGNKIARIIFTPRDEFGSRIPMDVIAANHPIIIMDEPQKMSGDKTKRALKRFNPLFTLNYSATHKEHHNLVYVLDAYDAYKEKLVKKIKVKGFDIRNFTGTNKYLFLENILISKKDPIAILEFEKKYANSIIRKIGKFTIGDDLYYYSNNMEQYKGYCINEIDANNNKVTFTNGIELHIGEVIGDISEKDIRRVQIRETIKAHFEKEKQLFNMGIKVLSLFFIDKVENYRKYDETGNEINSEYGTMFEQEYQSILNEYLTLFNTPYEDYLRKIDISKTHTGYFSIDKKGHKVDSKLKRGSDISDDESAYDLIMKDKEKLLSLDNPVRFIFSHSALREGWDNPNIFQICTLKHGGDSTVNKRQEVGRGLRICVNKNGDRMDVATLGEQVHEINLLTVIASDGYKDFVSSLQKDIRDNLYTRPTKATVDYFEDKKVKVGNDILTVTKEQAHAIYRYLVKNDYIDDNDQITDQYHIDLENNQLQKLPDSLSQLGEGVHTLIESIFDEHVFNEMFEDANETKIQNNDLNDNFYKKEFQTLWNYINHKYTYRVDFDSAELVNNSINAINEKLFVSKLQYTVTSGTQGEDWATENTNSSKEIFVAESKTTYNLERTEVSQVKYDLIGKIASGTTLTRKTIVKILQGITPVKFEMFKYNPEEFITKVIKLINEQKATIIVDDITYNETEDRYESDIFTAEKNKDFKKAYLSKKNVQDYVFTDGYAEKSTERKFAEEMDLDDKVAVYAKLPRGFQIPTPVGNYAPDWAICFKKGTVKHIFFVAETKGSMDSMQIRPIEQAKINCAKKLFKNLSTKDIVYHDVESFQNLLDIMEAL